jgi:cell division protein ZapA (FtsZ GTPase activity inhibitor)
VGQLVTIELFGRPYTFKTESESDKAQEVADILIKEVAKVQSRHAKETPGITQMAILIIAALNIANENAELKKNRAVLLQDISERSEGLIRKLEGRFN